MSSDLAGLPRDSRRRASSTDDEKASVKDSSNVISSPMSPDAEKKAALHGAGPLYDEDGHPITDLAQFGDVYETVREIDLGDDGKEREFATDRDWSFRLISLEDDPTLPVWTFRMWFVALGLSCFGAVLTEIFVFRPTTIYVSQLFLQTFGYILGKLFEAFLPGPLHETKWLRTKDTRFWRWINPGKFNIKEHVATLIMCAAAVHGALAINIFAAQDLYYNSALSPAIAIFTLLGSQLLGYGLGGMMRSFLVYPTVAVYPNVMPTIQMFDLLHRGHENILQQKRLKVFWAVFIGIFVWQWFPEYIAPTLTGVSIVCLARRDSAWVSRIFGGVTSNEGLGLFSLSFDWNYVGSGGSAYGALFQPIQTQLSQYIGIVICIIAYCAVYANNIWNAQNMPFMSQLLYYTNGTEFDQLLILNDDFTLNRDKLNEQGLPWFASTQIIFKIGASLAFGASITHLFLWHWGQIRDAIQDTRADKIKDVHYEKMKVYKEVPFWWYGTVVVVSIAMGLATNETGKSQLPWWGFFIAVGFAALFMPVIGFLYATICYVPGTEDIARMLGAGICPGKPVANMYFTMYAYNSTEQGRSMTRDLKMGQYTKLPPRVTFTMQCLGSAIGALLNYVIMKIVIQQHRALLLDVQGSNVWSGTTIQSFNSEAIGWGALAKDLYSPKSRYGIVPLAILIGLAVPVPFWLLHRRFPKLKANMLITPMLCTQIGYMSGIITSSVFMTFLLCIFSQYYLRKYRPGIFRKYNFLLSAALDGGTEVMVFVFSFAVGGAGGKTVPFPNWALNPAEGNLDYCMDLNPQ